MDSNCWNSEDTCTYKQTILVNPLIGGFNPYAKTLEESKFISYQFFGDYKVTANNNTVTIYTTDKCSQMSVSFDYGCVIYQPKVKPQKRNTECKQVVEFQEQRYSIQIDPFTRESVDIGLIIFSTAGNLNFYNIDLKSLTNEEIISAQLYEFIAKHQPIILPIDDSGEVIVNSTRDIVVDGLFPQLTFELIPLTIFQNGSFYSQKFNVKTITGYGTSPGTTSTFIRWEMRRGDGSLVYGAPSVVGRDDFTFSASGSTIATRTYRIGFTFFFEGKNYFFGPTVTLPVYKSTASLVGYATPV